jgi:hypothetical protein
MVSTTDRTHLPANRPIIALFRKTLLERLQEANFIVSYKIGCTRLQTQQQYTRTAERQRYINTRILHSK